MNLEQKIESILFWKGEPIKIIDLAKTLEISEDEVIIELEKLRSSLYGRGISIIEQDKKVALVTSSENSEIIEKLQKEELTKDLTKATLETLSIILYRGPIKRAEIDYIRGVNSQFSIRNLLIRGLIDKKTDPKDERAYIYKPSIELLAFMGIEKVEELPDFESVNTDINNFLTISAEAENKKENEPTEFSN